MAHLRRTIQTIIIFIICTISLNGQNIVHDIILPDTVMAKKQQARSTEFYNHLKDGSRFSRLVHRAFVTSAPRQQDILDPQMVKETEYFSQFAGQRIENIYIYRNNVFNESSNNWVPETLNSIHKITLEKKIRHNLLFKSGEELSPSVMATNEQLLRELPYLADASIVVVDAPSGGINIYLFTRDKWTITAQLKTAENSNYYLRLYDNNFLGTGDQLGLRTYASLKNKIYGGNIFEYKMFNIGGTFFNAEFIAGVGYNERVFGGKLERDFILPADFAMGATLEKKQAYEHQILADTMLLTSKYHANIWAGKSWLTPAINGSSFATAGYSNTKYDLRPEITSDSNTVYHNSHTFLASFGVYQERFYRGNMIYGFGATEDIPYGYKFEITAGHVISEFNTRWYGSASFEAGRQTKIGYLSAMAGVSTFVGASGHLRQSILQGEINYFSNLMSTGRTGIRQFLDIRYMRGFHHNKGEGELLTFYEDNSPRGIRRDNIYGNHRLVLNTETVVFTPIYFYGFRFAFFGFADFSWLGEDKYIFKNDFYTTFGVGVRLKNERLIFSTIQLRLGFAVGKKGFMDSRYLRYSSQQRLNVNRFKPEGPQIMKYK